VARASLALLLLLLENTHTSTRSATSASFFLSRAVVARGQLSILALPIPHLQQHTGHCAPPDDEDEMHDQRLNRATQLRNTTSRK
jgi:hypothetical protein